MYSVDTLPGIVWSRPYDPAGGEWGERTQVVRLDHGGWPDGLCVDTDGNLWVAIWGGGEVRCYTPAGERLATVSVPAPHTTSVAFVGPDRDLLLITTATDQLSAAQLDAHPLSGRLFTAHVGRGRPARRPVGGAVRAFVVTGPGECSVQDVQPPSAGSGEVVVDVARVGVCGTDVEFFTGEMTYLHDGHAAYPMRLGHEWCGVVTAVGSGVEEAWLGRRVAGDTMLGCGRCHRCRSGRQHLCEDRFEVGIRGGKAGALAEQLAVPAASLVALPDVVDDTAGAMVEPGGNALRAVLGRRPGSGGPRPRAGAGDDRHARRPVRPRRRCRGPCPGRARAVAELRPVARARRGLDRRGSAAAGL